ncbi:MAG: phosphoribosylamine--glycine ligase [Solirubrobacteraceae bacterium]
MKILIIGSGGREHAIGWKIKRDNSLAQLFFAPGNAGTSELGTNILQDKIIDLLNFAKENKIDLTFVGSETLLVEGIVDVFKENNLKAFGPDKKSAQLEGSKAFAKDFMQKYSIKTARYKNFTNCLLAKEYLTAQEFPIVVKASGLAAGKGVVICQDLDKAIEAVDEIMEDKVFGDAGNEVVIEEFLEGFEASILSVFNGKEIFPFLSAKDHKKIGEGEKGLNTGGMGVVAPNPLFKENHNQQFIKDILIPTQKGLLKENLIFSGIIFFGLMITENGVYLLEYNLRMGDPETQALMPLLDSSFISIVENSLNQEPINLLWKNKSSCCVVLSSGGYPLNFEKGFEINGTKKVTSNLFIAGAVLNHENKMITAGGRVLNVVGLGNNLKEAKENAYNNIEHIHFDYQYFRKDIGDI